jgi:phosphomannomutase
MTKRKVARPPGGVDPTLDAVAASFGADGEEDRTDGLRISWSDRAEWVHVRPSGTEPVMRVIAEAPSAERSRELADRAERSVLGSD